MNIMNGREGGEAGNSRHCEKPEKILIIAGLWRDEAICLHRKYFARRDMKYDK
jgi:hypothetical protein